MIPGRTAPLYIGLHALAREGTRVSVELRLRCSSSVTWLSQRRRHAFARSSAAMHKCSGWNSGRFISVARRDYRVGGIAGNHVATAKRAAPRSGGMAWVRYFPMVFAATGELLRQPRKLDRPRRERLTLRCAARR